MIVIVLEPIPEHGTAVLTRGNFCHPCGSIIEPFRTIISACQVRRSIVGKGGNWHGLSTALHPSQQGVTVTIITPVPYVRVKLIRISTAAPLRAQLKQTDTRFMVKSVISQWDKDTVHYEAIAPHNNQRGTTITSLLDGHQTFVPTTALATATTNVTCVDLSLVIVAPPSRQYITSHTIGNAVAPRQAPYVFYKGKKLELRLS